MLPQLLEKVRSYELKVTTYFLLPRKTRRWSRTLTRTDAPAGPERGLRTWPLRVRILALVTGIGALAGFERGPSVSARVLALRGSLDKHSFTYVPRGRDGGGWITARSEVVIDGGMISMMVERWWEGGRWAEPEPVPALVLVPVPEPQMA